MSFVLGAKHFAKFRPRFKCSQTGVRGNKAVTVTNESQQFLFLLGIDIDLATVQTNIVIFRTAEGAPDAATVVARAKENGVLVGAFAARTVRAVTHLDVTRDQANRAVEVLAAAIASR